MNAFSLSCMVFSIIFAALAQILLKYATIKKTVLFTLYGLDVPVFPLLSVGSYFFAFVLYYFTLKGNELSIISPLCAGATFVVIIALSSLIFGETLTLAKITGIAFIFVGIIILSALKS